MSVGKKILKLRLDARLTQQYISDRTGLAVSYISRIENGRITPSVHTMSKIAAVLRVPVTAFFDSEPTLSPSECCPVSMSGRCILEHLFVGRGRAPMMPIENYTPKQLEVLRLCNHLLHTGDRKTINALTTLLRSLTLLGATEPQDKDGEEKEDKDEKTRSRVKGRGTAPRRRA